MFFNFKKNFKCWETGYFIICAGLKRLIFLFEDWTFLRLVEILQRKQLFLLQNNMYCSLLTFFEVEDLQDWILVYENQLRPLQKNILTFVFFKSINLFRAINFFLHQLKIKKKDSSICSKSLIKQKKLMDNC